MGCLELADNVLEVFKAPEVQIVAVIGISLDEKLLEQFWAVCSFDDLAI